MIARHFKDSVGIYIHTDFDIKAALSRPVYKAFVYNLANLGGVEKYSITKYSIAASFGYLFDWDKVSEGVINLFNTAFGVDASDEITTEEIIEKVSKNTLGNVNGSSSIPTIDFSAFDKIIDA